MRPADEDSEANLKRKGYDLRWVCVASLGEGFDLLSKILRDVLAHTARKFFAVRGRFCG